MFWYRVLFFFLFFFYKDSRIIITIGFVNRRNTYIYILTYIYMPSIYCIPLESYRENDRIG